MIRLYFSNLISLVVLFIEIDKVIICCNLWYVVKNLFLFCFK